MAFLCLEGVDGVGKSTQVQLLCQWLREQGYTVLACRDPGGTPLGEKIRELLLQGSEISLCAGSEMLLYMASRAQLVQAVIRPALDRGDVVVTDRYLLANIVYQARAGVCNAEEVRSIGRMATGGLLPDLTFLLDMPADSAQRRLARTLDRMESRGLEYLTAVRDGYHHEAAMWPAPVVVVDADRPVEDVQHELRRLTSEFLQASHEPAADKPAAHTPPTPGR